MIGEDEGSQIPIHTSEIRYKLLGEFPGVILPWLPTELVVKLWSNVSNCVDFHRRSRDSRRRVRRWSIHYTASQIPSGAISQSPNWKVVGAHSIVADKSLESKPKVGVTLNPAKSVSSHGPDRSMKGHT